jgi:hypothetical protein
MAGLYGDFVAKTAVQTDVAVTASAWVPLSASSGPLEARRHVRIQLKSNAGGAMAITYVSVNADGTFTTPTTATSVKTATIMPGNSTWIEPLGDTLQAYGKLVKKAGFTPSSIRAIVTEYA